MAATNGTLRGDPLTYPFINSELPLQIIDTLHLVCRWDYVEKKLTHYDLKTVAEEFGISQPNRVILSADEISQTFHTDPTKFNSYLEADLTECWGLFERLFLPFWMISQLTGLPPASVCVKSTAWIWEKILEREYRKVGLPIPDPDEKKTYKGGLVVARQGLFSPCFKIDVASLYPTIMLTYRIHSRKDVDGIALRWLKTLTEERLKWKKKAKEGDKLAEGIQLAMKTLINSLYGFYGTGGYGFNDMDAAARVTQYGRKILTAMISAIEGVGGVVVEADTDGIIVQHHDPQTILQVTKQSIPPVFKLELEWAGAIVFVSDEKNYIILSPEGEILQTKGSVWKGRDKPKLQTEFVPTFLRLFATQGKEVALRFAESVRDEIASGRGWEWVKVTKRVGRGNADKFLKQVGFKEGEKVTFAYSNRKKKEITTNPDEKPYDAEFYLKEFSALLDKVMKIIQGGET